LLSTFHTWLCYLVYNYQFFILGLLLFLIIYIVFQFYSPVINLTFFNIGSWLYRLRISRSTPFIHWWEYEFAVYWLQNFKNKSAVLIAFSSTIKNDYFFFIFPLTFFFQVQLTFKLINRLGTRCKLFLKNLMFLFLLKFNIIYMFWIVLMCWCQKWFLKNKKTLFF
jgi:hypothetical protein